MIIHLEFDNYCRYDQYSCKVDFAKFLQQCQHDIDIRNLNGGATEMSCHGFLSIAIFVVILPISMQQGFYFKRQLELSKFVFSRIRGFFR